MVHRCGMLHDGCTAQYYTATWAPVNSPNSAWVADSTARAYLTEADRSGRIAPHHNRMATVGAGVAVGSFELLFASPGPVDQPAPPASEGSPVVAPRHWVSGFSTNFQRTGSASLVTMVYTGNWHSPNNVT